MINTTVLEEIVSSLSALDPAPDGLTHVRVVKDTRLGAVKVRVYATEAEACEKEALLNRLKGEIDFPKVLGRQQQYLIFRYLDLQTLKDDSPGLEVCFLVGHFLAVLNSVEEDQTNSQALDQEFMGWMHRLSEMRLIPAPVARKACTYYREKRPVDLPVRLDYWDAMPHNFGLLDGRLIMLDEKHVRPSFPGVGLVKPLFLLPAGHWNSLRQGYESLLSLDLFDRHREFIQFYYLACALSFYSLISSAGRASLGRNPRFLAYRDQFTRMACNNNWADQARSELELYTSFSKDLLFLFKRRLGLIRSGLADRSR